MVSGSYANHRQMAHSYHLRIPRSGLATNLEFLHATKWFIRQEN
jgi:hypothetical protein